MAQRVWHSLWGNPPLTHMGLERAHCKAREGEGNIRQKRQPKLKTAHFRSKPTLGNICCDPAKATQDRRVFEEAYSNVTGAEANASNLLDPGGTEVLG